jgi:hypothetical protein
MIFGTVFTGHVKTQEKQWIETKLFCLFIPLYVVNTMLVTDVTGNGRRGIPINTNSTSIIAAIIRPIVTVICLFSIGAFIGNYDTMLWLLIPAILSVPLFIYGWFFFGKTTKHEKFVRKQFGLLFGLYFMPEWLPRDQVISNFENLKKAYVSNFGTTDWKEKVRNAQYNSEGFSLFYCLTALENCLDYNAETEKMLKEISAQNIDK